MSVARRIDPEFPVDFSEKQGFLTGKAAAMADWAHRKEAGQYERLFERLRARNWARRDRQLRPGRAQARCLAWRRANRDRVRASDRRQKRAARLRQLRAIGALVRVIDGVPRRAYLVTCGVCGARVEKLQPGAAWCSKRCANRYHGAPRSRARNRGLRNMTIAADAKEHLRASPWLTAHELQERMPGAKFGSLASLLCTWVKAGVLQHRKVCRGTRYALAALQAPRISETGAGGQEKKT